MFPMPIMPRRTFFMVMAFPHYRGETKIMASSFSRRDNSHAPLFRWLTHRLVIVQINHANIELPGWLEHGLRAFIVTPVMHKVHHSRWRPETDSNYSSLLSIWDRLLGSFRLRDNPRTIEFGLDDFDTTDRQTLVGLLRTPLDEVPRDR
ncbi:MAG: sterol desaturase family protein [Verrucomicrobiota bacterium]